MHSRRSVFSQIVMKGEQKMTIKFKQHWTTLLAPLVFLPILLQGEGASLNEALLKAGKLILMIQFTVILPHELSHLLASWLLGVRRGTLFLAGILGAWIPDDDKALSRLSPRQRIAIFVLGPVANLLLAAVLAALVFHSFPIPHFLRKWLELACVFNLVAACVNLLPVYPMDGGRILKEVLDLLDLQPPKIAQVMCVAALIFGFGFFGLLIICGGHWVDLVLWLLVLAVSALCLKDMKEASKS